MRQTRSQAKIAKTNNGNNPQLEDIEELKVIISSFNSRELSDILGIEYNSKQSKANLRSNVLKQLQSSFSTTQDKIRLLQNNRKVPIEPPTSQMYHQDMSMVVSQQGNGTANHPNGTNNGVVVYNQQGVLTHPNIKLKKLAFFEVMGVLLKPTTLHSTPTQRVQEGTYYFHLSPQQATDLASNRNQKMVLVNKHQMEGREVRKNVDLTQSDSDDDVPLKKNLPPPKQIISNPAPVNATAASRTNDVSIISLDSPTPPSSPVNISSVYVDTPPSHMINTNSGVSSTTHNNWSNPAINSLSNNYNLLPSSPLLQDPLGGGLNEFYQRQILRNNSPNIFNSYSTADEDNRY